MDCHKVERVGPAREQPISAPAKCCQAVGVEGCQYIYIFWLHWVFIAVRGLSLVAESGGSSSLWCTGFSLRWILLLQSMGSRAQAQ